MADEKQKTEVEVEGQAFRRNRNDEAAAPADETTVEADESRETDAPEVEGNAFRRN